MATPNFNIWEDVTIFDVVWIRISDNEEQKGSGERGGCAFFEVERSLTPASSAAQTPSTAPIPMIASFYWESSSAKFACDYNPTSRTYDQFDLVEGSMTEDLTVALAYANEFDNQPDLSELDEGKWKLEMHTMYQGWNPSYVEMWAKQRVNDVQARATDDDMRDWGVGSYGRVEEEEEEEAGEAEEEQEEEQEDEQEEHEEEQEEQEEEEHIDA